MVYNTIKHFAEGEMGKRVGEVIYSNVEFTFNGEMSERRR